jgi:hypothetical protein
MHAVVATVCGYGPTWWVIVMVSLYHAPDPGEVRRLRNTGATAG